MSFIRNIDGIPLYTTIEEAELWASQYNLTGYHTHNVLGQIGYMGGIDHATITAAMNQEPINTVTPQQVRNVRINQTTISPVSSSSGGGGGY